jgi:Protein of unknown function (DUF1553)/Protein of unknown function (DUF1549)/Planctomycete cytochrome C/Concanavalin A-like lectin/glucanases superfamily
LRSETLRNRFGPGVSRALFLVLSCGLLQPPTGATEPVRADSEFFEKDVRPLLVEKCWPCHGDTGRPKGGLRLTSRPSVLKGGDSGAAVVAGDPMGSPLIQAVRYENEPKMPPKAKLKDREIDVLTRWVILGLPWPDTKSATASPAARPALAGLAGERRRFWAFPPVGTVVVPSVGDASWVRSAIDRFLLAGLEKKGLQPAAAADRRTLLRRATFDLIGLPPTPAEVTAFLADPSPQAFERVVDRLLASPRYGERWGRHWLDVVRYADARDLIQLPAASDFREAWRYRDWVVAAFNRDLPYQEFVRYQVAGDLLTPPEPGGINKDGLVATGLLAIADFVPGDVDKEQMIADYVNDQIDVVSKAFLGLSIACARCHDHKFDPISIEDYYALAGIFFSTRLIPGPVPGNTPLVRADLLSHDELIKVQARDAADKRRRVELEQQLPDAADRAYVSLVRHLLADHTASYLVAASECRQRIAGQANPPIEEMARRRGLRPEFLAGFVAYLGRVAAQPTIDRHATVRDAAAGSIAGAKLENSAAELQCKLAALVERDENESAGSPERGLEGRSSLIRLRADDPYLVIDRTGRVLLWPNRTGLPADARPLEQGRGPVKTCAVINGVARLVLRFDGEALLELPRKVPNTGTLFVVCRTADTGSPSQRLLGWEDSDGGKHGLGLMPDPRGRLHAILRNNGQSGDLVDAHPGLGFELVCVTWGSRGTTLHRNGTAAGSQKGVDEISSDPAVAALRVGGPGSGNSPRYRGDIAEIRVYDRQLDETERQRVERELRAAWLDPAPAKPPERDALKELYEEWLSARGPFWLAADARRAMLPAREQSRLDSLSRELDLLKKRPPTDVPRAVVVQEGGPKGTRHEGFKDAQVFLRGNPHRLGKAVARGLPRVLLGEREPPMEIKEGSGRRELAEWLTHAANPLTARVMVNRIWQHHFGQGLVATPNDFGARGERPANPELLDWLAARFVQSGWSVKAIHRLILLSSTYQQSSRASAEALALDPDNRLLGRMNRRRLDAEAIRDSLLTFAGRLDARLGGTSFSDLAVPRRTLYLQSVRTGPASNDFGRLFDRADPGSIVAERGESVVAPQALFFLNDPFVSDNARALAARIARDEPGTLEARIESLYAYTLGRPPAQAELDLGTRLLTIDQGALSWERYCHLILCQNEILYTE